MKSEMQDILLEFKNVTFSYEGEKINALDHVNLKIHRGRKIAFMGANGSGKSTLFLCCNGIHKPDEGEIYFRGKPVAYNRKGLLDLRQGVGIVFQDPDNQLFSASVYQEISFGAFNIGMKEEEVREEVEKVIKYLEITPFKEKPTQALSGGQKKQVSIADILVMKPEIMILDEPAAALDPKHTRIVNKIVDCLTEEGITVLMATHDMDYAYSWADEIVLMHEGKILKQGNPVDVCRDVESLRRTNLEEPSVLRMYSCLCEKEILQENGKIPRNLRELMEQIREV